MAATGQADRQGLVAQLSQGEGAGGPKLMVSRIARAERKDTHRPARGWIKSCAALMWIWPVRSAQEMKGKAGVAPNGKSARASVAAANAVQTRVDQRSIGSGNPSCASGLSLKMGQKSEAEGPSNIRDLYSSGKPSSLVRAKPPIGSSPACAMARAKGCGIAAAVNWTG